MLIVTFSFSVSLNQVISNLQDLAEGTECLLTIKEKPVRGVFKVSLMLAQNPTGNQSGMEPRVAAHMNRRKFLTSQSKMIVLLVFSIYLFTVIKVLIVEETNEVDTAQNTPNNSQELVMALLTETMQLMFWGQHRDNQSFERNSISFGFFPRFDNFVSKVCKNNLHQFDGARKSTMKCNIQKFSRSISQQLANCQLGQPSAAMVPFPLPMVLPAQQQRPHNANIVSVIQQPGGDGLQCCCGHSYQCNGGNGLRQGGDNGLSHDGGNGFLRGGGNEFMHRSGSDFMNAGGNGFMQGGNTGFSHGGGNGTQLGQPNWVPSTRNNPNACAATGNRGAQ